MSFASDAAEGDLHLFLHKSEGGKVDMERRCQRDLYPSQDVMTPMNVASHYRPHSALDQMNGGGGGGFGGSLMLSGGRSTSLFEPRHIPNVWEELDMEGDTFQWTNCLHVVAEGAKECTVFLSQTHLSILYTQTQQSQKEDDKEQRGRERPVVNHGSTSYKNSKKSSTDPRALKPVSPNCTHLDNKNYNYNNSSTTTSNKKILITKSSSSLADSIGSNSQQEDLDYFQHKSHQYLKKVPTDDSIEVQDAGDCAGSNYDVVRTLDRTSLEDEEDEEDEDEEDQQEGPVEISWSLQSFTEAYPRRYRMRDTAIEIFGPSSTSVYANAASVAISAPSTLHRMGRTPTGRIKPSPPQLAATRDPQTGVLISPLSDKSVYISFNPDSDLTGPKDIKQPENEIKKAEIERRRRDFLWRLKLYAPQLNLDYWYSPPVGRPATSLKVKDPLRGLMDAWARGAISNYDYLMRLNAIAGRSVHDITSYPVLPWVLSNYRSQVLDLTDPRNYRDLSKPMGALHQERFQNVFMKKYRALESMNNVMSPTSQKQRRAGGGDDFRDEDGTDNDRTVIPPFMYGSHYSSVGGVVLHYLVRLKPFADLHKQLQGGKFDCADRLFDSVPRTWEMCSGSSPSEVKELTREWYSDPNFLRNSNRFKLGKSVDGKEISDVVLPPWADGSPEKFVQTMRNALESDECSKRLHLWIDLIFGYKQRGPEALNAHNVFYHLTYYDDADLSLAVDETRRTEMEMHMADFGRCPAQLFDQPHARKIIYNKDKSRKGV